MPSEESSQHALLRSLISLGGPHGKKTKKQQQQKTKKNKKKKNFASLAVQNASREDSGQTARIRWAHICEGTFCTAHLIPSGRIYLWTAKETFHFGPELRITVLYWQQFYTEFLQLESIYFDIITLAMLIN